MSKVIDKIDKQLDEAYQRVKIAGLPDMIIKGTTGTVRMLVKKKLKNPMDLEDIEKISMGDMKKYFRELAAGGGEEETSEAKTWAGALAAHAKKPVKKRSKEEKEKDLKKIREGRDFSNAHYALVKGKMYGDTQSIYILDELGGRIQHLGFGDFGTSNPIKLPGVGDVKIEYVRADGSATGDKLKKAGFSGRPHYIDFPGIDHPEKAAKALAKIYKQKGAVEVKA